MNTFTLKSIKVIPFVSMLAFSFVIEAKAPVNKDKKVDVKCFVELVGGGEVVSFWNVSTSKVSRLSKSIAGQKVTVPNSKQKVKIYKVHECALLKDDFTNSKAKRVDARTAR